MPKLTKLVVDAATPRDKQFTIWCSDLKGFGVFVHPSGTRTYFVDYRNAQNSRRRMTIGRHGTITAEQARKLAIATLGDALRVKIQLKNVQRVADQSQFANSARSIFSTLKRV